MNPPPPFEGTLSWEGQLDNQPFDYDHYNRSTSLAFAGGAQIRASAPAHFKGDDTRANPETLMLASLMQCHFLTFLAVASRAGLAVSAYTDHASGTLGMREGKMRYVEVRLRPRVRFVDAASAARLGELHDKAHANCFMANSVNFPVLVEPDLG